MTTPLVFTFPETAQHVRSVMIDGEPWWVAADVCTVLEIGNARQAVSYLDDDEVQQVPVTTNDGSSRSLPTNVISEPGLYSVILRSRKPQAKAFKRWITHEVIPSIRQTGSYSAAPREMTKLEALQAAIESEEGRLAAEARIKELEPAANSWQTLASGEGDFSVADAAKILSRDPSIETGRNRLFGILHELDWAYVQNADHRYRAKQYAVERRWLSELPQSYTHPRTGELTLGAPQLRVTVKGLHELHKRLGGTAAVQLPPAPVQGGAS
ncbi:phage antirepressor KilAC domain-containing protein [Streptomyces venezuelae]|uniref:Phage antirepressor protein n=1 Tax=Streptomyces venezuelae TaxID=54571 RepID=A0A5P2B5Z0_STRVZ|nr:phage antirepressor KilAC domain-containing protein [Streptomyces venezuelae]QES25905.1 phage antirepressor protein [Streptomyces venezuelae]